MDFVPDYITKVISNLLANAIKFIPEYGRVAITMWRKDDTLLLDITDTGRGMDEDTLKQVFELFYQAEGDTQNIGTGIGLALVKQIIEALNGTITVESTSGQGTAFHISLPIHNHVKQDVGEEKPVVTLPAEEKAEEEQHSTDSNSTDSNDDCRILVVEDNRINQRLMVAILKKLGHHVALASSGREALEYVAAQTFDLVLMDIQMPEMDGVETTQKIREREAQDGRHLPIIAVTAHAMAGDRERYLATGMDDYLTKPIKRNELIAALDRHAPTPTMR